MARPKTPQPVPTTVTNVGNLPVSLSLDDWKNVLACMEAGIRAIGFHAFESGGSAMRQIAAQLPLQTNTDSQTTPPSS